MRNYYNGLMMRSVLTKCMLLVFILKINAQVPDWTNPLSNGGADYDWGQSIASDSFGNTVVGGAFYSPTITFGSSVLTNSNAGKYTSFIVKRSTNGSVIWAKQPVTFGGSPNNRATEVCIDNFSNIYVTGIYFSTTITFDTITLTKTHCCLGAFYIVKYDPLGNVIWAITTYGEQSGAGAYPPQPYLEPSPLNKIAIDKNSGDVYLTGIFDSPTMNFGSTVLTNATINNGYYPQRDGFIAKYNSSGNFVWAKSIGGPRQDYTSDISVINSKIFVSGSFNSSVLNIGSSTLTNSNQIGSVNKYLPFVAKYDSAGNPQWAKQGDAVLPGIKTCDGKGVTTDLNGNSIFIGEFQGPSISFGNLTVYNTDSSGLTQIFVVKYDALGNVLWAKTFANGNGTSWASEVKTDGLGNIFVSGNVGNGSLIFDGVIVPFPNFGMFVAKLSIYGGFLWVKILAGTNNKQRWIIGLDVSSQGNVFTTGSFVSSIFFNSGNFVSNGLSDIFTASLLYCTPSFTPITAQGNTTFCQGDSVILSGTSGYINYQWYHRNYAIPGATSITYTAKSGGSYHCKSQNAMLCIDTSNTIIVHVPCIPIGPNQNRPNLPSGSDEQIFKLYPNPTTGIFVIHSPEGQLEIINSYGQLMRTYLLTRYENTFDLSDLPNGIYVLKLNTGKSNFTEKIVLNH